MYVYGSGQSPALQVAYFKRLGVLDGGHAFASHPISTYRILSQHKWMKSALPPSINDEVAAITSWEYLNKHLGKKQITSLHDFALCDAWLLLYCLRCRLPSYLIYALLLQAADFSALLYWSFVNIT